MKIKVVNMNRLRSKVLVETFSECIVEIDFDKLAIEYPELRGGPLYYIEKCLKEKLGRYS